MSQKYSTLIEQAQSLSPSDYLLKIFELRQQFEAEPDSTEKWRALGLIYTELGLHQSAYDAHMNISNPRERWKKTNFTRLKYMAETYGDERPKPFPLLVTSEIKDNLPTFPYCSDPLGTGLFKALREPVICECCGKSTPIFYDGSFYAVENISVLCPDCIHSGLACEKFDGDLIVHYTTENFNPDDLAEKIDTLTHRTPSYTAWQEAVWASHCGDFCDFVGYADWKRVKPLIEQNQLDYTEEGLADHPYLHHLSTNGSFVGYLFQCKKCSHYVLHADND